MEAIIVALGLTVLAVILLLCFLSHENYLHGLFKLLASTGFIALCIASGGVRSTYGQVILAGLVFSWWGDLFLISRSSTIFMLGLISFFLAHVAYCGAFVVYGVSAPSAVVAMLLLLLPGVFIMRWLHPHLGSMRVPVYAYVTVITVMTALAVSAATSRGGVLLPIGAILFYSSDIFVARDRFVAPGRANAYIGLPLYYGGQVLLAMTPLYTQ